MQTEIDYAWNHGVVVVAAAGNSGSAGAVAPAWCTHVLAVAASDASDSRASSSNYGAGAALAAPGASVLTTDVGGGYSSQSGTSFAAAHVSGAAALVWSTRWSTTNQAVVDRLSSTADRISGTGTLWQSGRLDLAAAVGAQRDADAHATSHWNAQRGAVATPSPTATPDPLIYALGTATSRSA